MLLWCHRPLLEMVDLALNPEAQDAYWAAAVLRTEVGARVLMRDDVLFSWNFFFFCFCFLPSSQASTKTIIFFYFFFPAVPVPKGHARFNLQEAQGYPRWGDDADIS